MVGDDDVPSRSGTPRPLEPKRQKSSTESSADPKLDAADSSAQERTESRDSIAMELPTDVRVKLRKLDKLESKYHGTFV